MNLSSLLFVLLALSSLAYFLARRRALSLAGTGGGQRILHSLPSYYGWYAALWCALPAMVVLIGWLTSHQAILNALLLNQLPPQLLDQHPQQLNLLLNDIRNHATGNIVSGAVTPDIASAAEQYLRMQFLAGVALWVLAIAAASAGLAFAIKQVSASLRARNVVEKVLLWSMITAASIAILTTFGLLLSVIYESLQFFSKVPFWDFVLGTEWSPQIALREDQVAATGSFGAIPLFTGTLMVSAIAMLVAVPIGLMSAIYLSEYAGAGLRSVAKPVLEILAGIPTVVYGFFAALTVAPAIRAAGESLGLAVASESALAAGLVMGIMIIPFVSSLADDVINAVPQSLRDGSYAMGATQSETIRKVVLPAALPGIVGGILLAVSRAIGETMIVVMAAGLSARLTANPLESVTTVTVQIVTLLTGDQEFDSAKTLAAFALGLTLFIVTLLLNIVALHVVRKYREQYE